MDSLNARKLNGMKWMTVGTVISVAVQTLSTAVMARLLTPTEFGVMAIAMIFLRFGGYISKIGVNRAIVQKTNITQTDIVSSFSLTLILGGVSCLLMMAVSPLAKVIYGNGQLIPLICLTSLSFIFSSLSMTPFGLLQRGMRFREIMLGDVLSYSIGYAGVGILLASLGMGVWSIAVATITQNFLLWLLRFAFQRHPLRFHLDRVAARQIIGFGGKVTLISWFEYIGGSLDVFVIGKFWNEATVGLYSKAVYLVMLPLQHISNTLTMPMFSALCKSRTDITEFRKEFVADFLATGIIQLSLCTGMAFAGFELISILLGEQWLAIVNVFSVLCIAYAIYFVNTILGITLEACNVLKKKLMLQWAQIIMLLVLFYFTRGFGLQGIAVSVLAVQALKHIALMLITNQVVRMKKRELLSIYFDLAYVILAQILLQYSIGQVFSWVDSSFIMLIVRVFAGLIAIVISCMIIPTKRIRVDFNIMKIMKSMARR